MSGRFKVYPNDFELVHDSYVVVNRNMLRNLIAANKKLEFPSEVGAIPSNWTEITSFGDFEDDMIEIYSII